MKGIDSNVAGYPSFAEFLGSDERWMMFRRNSSVQARLILEKQDDMRTLEEELLEMDIDDLAKEPREPNNSRRRLFTRHRTNEEEAKARRELLKKLENSYLEYERLLSAAYRLNTLPRPAAFEWKSVLEYVRSAKPIVKRESDYIHARGDLISLRGTTEHAYLGGLIEQFFNQIRDWTTVLEQRQRFSMRTWLKGNYVAKGAGEKFARAFIGVMVLLLVPVFFTVPIYALTKIGDDIGKSIGALVAFALTFAAVLLTATPARQHEVLGGTAAYVCSF